MQGLEFSLIVRVLESGHNRFFNGDLIGLSKSFPFPCDGECPIKIRKLDNGKQIDVIYLDMSKAFDKVSHAQLLRRLL